jgi:hypothetical protein
MKLLLRHLLVAALPLVCGLGAGYGFALRAHQRSCTALVGPVFAAKCHGRELEYQLRFQTAGTAAGTVIAAFVGIWLELRRRRAVQPSDTTPE